MKTRTNRGARSAHNMHVTPQPAPAVPPHVRAELTELAEDRERALLAPAFHWGVQAEPPRFPTALPPGSRVPAGARKFVRRLSDGEKCRVDVIDALVELSLGCWDAMSLASVLVTRQRLLEDVVYVLLVEVDGVLYLAGALFGRASARPDASFDQLHEDAPVLKVGAIRAMVFYQVMIAESCRGRAALLLLERALEETRVVYGRAVRKITASPVWGLRPYVAWLLGYPMDLTPYQERMQLRLSDLERGRRDSGVHPELLTQLAALAHRDVIERETGSDVVSYLRQRIARPEWLWRDWECGSQKMRVALEELIRALALLYCSRCVVRDESTSNRAALLCFVSHAHLKMGGRFDGIRPFGRKGDPESLFANQSFDYDSGWLDRQKFWTEELMAAIEQVLGAGSHHIPIGLTPWLREKPKRHADAYAS